LKEFIFVSIYEMNDKTGKHFFFWWNFTIMTCMQNVMQKG